MRIDDFIANEPPVTGATTEACDTYGVHSHAFMVNVLGDGKTSVNAGHFHIIHNGIVSEVMDDAKTVHNHNLVGVQQAANTPSYGCPDLPSAAEQAILSREAEARNSTPLFTNIYESFEGMAKGDPYFAWSRLTSSASPDEINVLDMCFKEKAAVFKDKMNKILDELLDSCPAECSDCLKRKLDDYSNLPLSSAVMLPSEDIGRCFGNNAVYGALKESQYIDMAKGYLKEMLFELQAIALLNEGKTYDAWMDEQGMNLNKSEEHGNG